MKKFALLLALLLLAIMPAMAEETAARAYTIHMTEVDVAFAVPEGMLCLTNETSASVFNEWGMSQREVFAYMEEWDVYAMLYDLDTGESYQVSIYPFMASDYDKLTDAETLETLEGLKDEMLQAGCEVLLAEWYQGGSCNFAALETSSEYEDGYAEESCHYFTNQAEYCVTIVGYPYEGDLTDAVRANVRLMADSLTITPTWAYTPAEEFVVDTREQGDGSVILDMPGVRMTIVPLDTRFIVTRESDKKAFSRMGYPHQKAITMMEEYEIYAMLMDEARQVEFDVYLYGLPGAEDYSRMDDLALYEMGRKTYLEYDWTVEALDVFAGETTKFTRATVSYTETDGTVDRRVIYCTRIHGCEISVQVFPQNDTALEKCAETMDAFVRSIVFEVTAE